MYLVVLGEQGNVIEERNKEGGRGLEEYLYVCSYKDMVI